MEPHEHPSNAIPAILRSVADGRLTLPDAVNRAWWAGGQYARLLDAQMRAAEVKPKRRRTKYKEKRHGRP